MSKASKEKKAVAALPKLSTWSHTEHLYNAPVTDGLFRLQLTYFGDEDDYVKMTMHYRNEQGELRAVVEAHCSTFREVTNDSAQIRQKRTPANSGKIPFPGIKSLRRNGMDSGKAEKASAGN